MGWHYAARKTKGDFGEDEYELVEVFPELSKDGSVCCTENSVKVFGEGSKEDLAKWLRIAADDVEKYDEIVRGDDDN